MSIKEYFKNVDSFTGSVNPHVWKCIEPIHKYQEENSITGPIGEIGVHHGKFYVGLALLKAKQTDHLAIDVFDLQQFNLDNSGHGNYQKFLENVNKYKIPKPDINKFDSMAIPEAFIRERENKYSIFSVDACHLPEHTINDFKVAMRMTHNAGVILIDDYYNPLWPGVQEGVTKFYLNEYCNYVPFLYTCNKLFVCNYSYHTIYIDYVHKYLKKHYPSCRVRKVPRFGYETLTVIPDNKDKRYISSIS